MAGRDQRSVKEKAKEIGIKAHKSSKQAHLARKAKKAAKEQSN
jgi:hypothetical protein